MIVYLGCYTDGSHPNGLKTLELDETSGKMSVVAEHPVPGAIYQALSPDGRWLYSCTGRGLASFDVSQGGRAAETDSIDLCDLAAPHGTSSLTLCHIAAMPDGKSVVFADYINGFAGSAPVGNGKFGKPLVHRHFGSGPNLPRQNSAHCHQAAPLPGGSGYAVCDLGLDEIVEYPSGRIFKTHPAGAGPRHLLFHPGGRLAFLVSELGNLVSSLSWSQAKGFEILDTASTMEADHAYARLCMESDPGHLAAAIRFAPGMERIVVSNRGENSLAVFDFDGRTGRLAFKSRTILQGSWPRDFIFVSPALALVAMERSGEVHSLRYDAATGNFSLASTLGGLFRPVALTAIRGK